MQSNVILEAAKFTELLLTSNVLAGPDTIHPVSRFILFVVYYVVWELLPFEFRWSSFLLDRLAKCGLFTFGCGSCTLLF